MILDRLWLQCKKSPSISGSLAAVSHFYHHDEPILSKMPQYPDGRSYFALLGTAQDAKGAGETRNSSLLRWVSGNSANSRDQNSLRGSRRYRRNDYSRARPVCASYVMRLRPCVRTFSYTVVRLRAAVGNNCGVDHRALPLPIGRTPSRNWRNTARYRRSRPSGIASRAAAISPRLHIRFISAVFHIRRCVLSPHASLAHVRSAQALNTSSGFVSFNIRRWFSACIRA